jgi:hypothetical protein
MGVDDLFREIGTTLRDAGNTALSAGVATVRTAIARDAISSAEGQAVISDYRNQQIMGYLPWILAAVVGLFLLGRIRV